MNTALEALDNLYFLRDKVFPVVEQLPEIQGAGKCSDHPGDALNLNVYKIPTDEKLCGSAGCLLGWYITMRYPEFVTPQQITDKCMSFGEREEFGIKNDIGSSTYDDLFTSFRDHLFETQAADIAARKNHVIELINEREAALA